MATDHSDYRLPRYAVELLEELEEAHPIGDLVTILMNPALTNEQRLTEATKRAAQIALILGIKDAMREDYESDHADLITVIDR